VALEAAPLECGGGLLAFSNGATWQPTLSVVFDRQLTDIRVSFVHPHGTQTFPALR
jgi:hypothetical protein